MGSPERKIEKLGVEGVVLVGVVLTAVAYRAGLVKIGDSQEPIDSPQNSPGQTIDSRSYEVGVVSENLKLALKWIASQENPAFDAAIEDISSIHQEIAEKEKYFYISDIDPSSQDQNYADIAYRRDQTGGSLIIVLSREQFSDRAFDSAAAGKALLKAWKKRELAENDSRVREYNPEFEAELDLKASQFVDDQLARR